MSAARLASTSALSRVAAFLAAAACLGFLAPPAAAEYEMEPGSGQELVLASGGIPEMIVVPGTRNGPQPSRARRLSADDLGFRGPEYDYFGQYVMDSGDVDGDGTDDLVVGAIDTEEMRGAIGIVPGGTQGLDEQRSYAVEDSELAWLGQAVLVEDVDRDGVDDVIATYWDQGDPGMWPVRPGEDRTLRVAILWGSAQGVQTSNATTFAAPPQDVTSSAPQVLLDSGNPVGDRRREIVVVDRGPLYGEDGLDRGQMLVCTVAPARSVTCGPPHDVSGGINDVVVADVVGGGRDDIVLGEVFFEEDEDDGGRLHLYEATSGGLAPAFPLSQETPGVPGSDEERDGFGWSLAAADLNGDGKDDLAVGAPGEDFAKGRVTLLYGHRQGLGEARDVTVAQHSRGVPGRPERGDRFGEEVSVLDVDGNGARDVIVGSPNEDGTVGIVTIIRSTRAGRLDVRNASEVVRLQDVGIDPNSLPGSPRFGEQIGR